MNWMFSDQIGSALALTIAHSIWQGAILALIMSTVLLKLKNTSSSYRYSFAAAMPLIMLATSIITFCLVYQPVENIAVQSLLNTTELSKSSSTIPPEEAHSLYDYILANHALINIFWFFGVLFFIIKHLFGLGYIHYLRNSAIPHPMLDIQLQKIKNLVLYDSPVKIRASSIISVPMALGHLRPLILFPASMVTQLDQDEIQAIVLHELSHIMRNDYIVNIVLSMIETLYFYHPAIWWINANIREEREHCCDDLAIKYQSNEISYIKALMKIEEIRQSNIPALAIPFAGGKKNQLLNRMKRIMKREQSKNEWKEKSIATILLLSVFVLFSSNKLPSNTPERTETKTEVQQDTIKWEGEEDITIEIENGLVSTFLIDGDSLEVKFLDKINEMMPKGDLAGRPKTMTMIGKPKLIFSDGAFSLFGDSTFIEVEEFIKTDTIPGLRKKKSNVLIKKSTINGELTIEMEDEAIKSLEVDGKKVPPSEYYKYQDEIDEMTKDVQFDQNGFFLEFDSDESPFKGLRSFDFQMDNIPNLDSVFSKSFGFIFDGDEWRSFGGDIEQFFDKEQMRSIEKLHENQMKGIEPFLNEDLIEQSERFFGLYDMLDDLEDLRDQPFEFQFKDQPFNSKRTLSQQIEQSLNRDQLLSKYKTNEIELTGKHLKINGEKMPTPIYEKYKSLYEENTGIKMTKDTKIVLELESNQKLKSKSY